MVSFAPWCAYCAIILFPSLRSRKNNQRSDSDFLIAGVYKIVFLLFAGTVQWSSLFKKEKGSPYIPLLQLFNWSAAERYCSRLAVHDFVPWNHMCIYNISGSIIVSLLFWTRLSFRVEAYTYLLSLASIAKNSSSHRCSIVASLVAFLSIHTRLLFM